MKKFTSTIVAVSTTVMMLAAIAIPAPAQAQTVAELTAMVNDLLAKLAALQGGSSTTVAIPQFTRNLTIGSQGADVTNLQKFLISKGHVIAAGATGYFGAQTRAALAAYQAANGIAPAVGYFGPITMAKVNAAVSVVVPPVGTSTPDTTLKGGAGTVETYTIMSKHNNEEVGEGQNDVKVTGVEIEADPASDLRFTAVKVDFAQGTANVEFDKYAKDVSVWFDGKEVARVDADEFDEDNGWARTLTLDAGAIVKAGEKKNLEVAVSGISNMDSAEAGDTWTADITSVRFVDATGASVSEDPTIALRTLTFATFATANEVELKIQKTSASPEETVALVDADGDQILLLEFTIQAKGSDINIDDIPVAITSGGTNVNVADVADTLKLKWGSDEQSQTLDDADTSETPTFDNLDIDIEAGKKVTFQVIAESATSSVAGAQAATLAAAITVDDIDAKDSSGETVADADATGTASGDTQHIFTIAPEIKVTSVDIDPIDNGTAPAESAQAVVNLSITARGGTLYLNGDNETTEGNRFFRAFVYGSGNTASTSASTTVYTVGGQYTVTNSGADDEYYTINEDETMTVKIESTIAQAVVTGTPISAGLKADLIQFGTVSTNDTTRSAIDMNWTDLTDKTQSGTWSLVNAS